MTDFQNILLSLCRSCLSGKEIDTLVELDNFDWSDVYELSQQQSVTGIVFDVVQKEYGNADFSTLDMQTKLEWYACQQQIEQQNRKLNLVLYKVVGLLNKHGIRVGLLKGQGLAQMYPKPEHRVPGDIDLFVGVENDKKIRELFAQQGWLDKNLGDENIKHWTFSLDGILIEMHYYCTIIPGLRRNLQFQRMMDRALIDSIDGFFVNENGEAGCTRGEFVKTLPLFENTLFTFIHMFQHFLSGGMSLRQLMDLGFIIKRLQKEYKQSRIDYEMNQLLKKTGFLRSWQVFGCVMVKYLGFKPEEYPCYNAKYENKAEKILDSMFESAEKRTELRGNKDFKNGVWNKAKHYIGVCTKHFKMIQLFPSECFSSFFYMLADVSTKHYHRAKSQCANYAN